MVKTQQIVREGSGEGDLPPAGAAQHLQISISYVHVFITNLLHSFTTLFKV